MPIKKFVSKMSFIKSDLDTGRYTIRYRAIAPMRWPTRFIVPKNVPQAGRKLNSIRAQVEHTVGRLKAFGVLSTSSFRSVDYDWHGDLTQLVCRLVNLKFDLLPQHQEG